MDIPDAMALYCDTAVNRNSLSLNELVTLYDAFQIEEAQEVHDMFIPIVPAVYARMFFVDVVVGIPFHGLEEVPGPVRLTD